MQPANLPKSNPNRKELRVTKIVLIMILTFLTVWSPYAIAVIFAVSKVRNFYSFVNNVITLELTQQIFI